MQGAEVWLVRCSSLVLMLTLSLALIVRADDAPVTEEAVPQKVIVLRTGRVILGDVVERPGGYLVDNTIGQMVIPFNQVRLTALDLPEAYRKLKGSITEPTAGAHISLGQWCFENRLYDSARDQVKSALILEPQRKEARELLKLIERTTIGDAFDATIPAAPSKTRDGYDKGSAQALAGLSTSVTQDFVRKVQPLLMNKCGNVRCHGSAGTSDFHLAQVRLGMSGYRSITDRNLSAILQYVDLQLPQASALLIVPQGTHGGTDNLWSGPRTEEQLAELRAWVTRVALEQAALDPGAATSVANASARDSRTRRDPFLQEVLAEERPDRFDPAIFNRLMHGRE